MTYLESEWTAFEKECEIDKMGVKDRTLLRLTFFSGAARVVQILNDKHITDEKAVDTIEDIADELTEIALQQ